MSFKEEMNRRVGDIEKTVRAFLPEETGFQKTVMEAMNYSVLAGGKRLRPLLMSESCRLFGREAKELPPFLAAIEMIHTSSLVHDDLPAMDADEYRRGKKTTWNVYGEDMAILAGDALMIYAFETAAKAFRDTDRPDLVGRCIGILAEKTGIYGMIGGQTVDVELTGKPIPAEKLDFIYRLKTGALLECSLMIGAVLGGRVHPRRDCALQGDAGARGAVRARIRDPRGPSQHGGAGARAQNHRRRGRAQGGRGGAAENAD